MAGYGTDPGFNGWLAAHGYALPAGAPAVAVLRQRGSSYLDGTYGAEFTGTPTGGYAQERAWPRTDATAYGEDIPVDEIPVAIEESSYFAAYQSALNPKALIAGSSASGQIKKEEIEDAVKVEYFEGKGDHVAGAVPKFSFIEGLIAPFLGTSSQYGNYGAVLVV